MKDLVCKIKAGDEDAFEYLKSEWRNRLKIFARSYVRIEAVAEDLLQDSFLKVWETRSSIENDNQLAPYIYTVLKNKCLDYLRHKIVELKFQESTSNDFYYLKANLYALEDNSIDLISESQLKRALIAAVKKLPEPRREIFIMSRFRDMKNIEIAKEMNLSIKTVEYHITKSISFLREELKDFYILLYFFLIR